MATVRQLTQTDETDRRAEPGAGASDGQRNAAEPRGEQVTGEVMVWAREESGYELSEVADKLGVDESVILDWEAERSRPSKGQVTELSKLYNRQPIVLSMPEAPPPLLSPEFRWAPGLGSHKLSPKELVTIREVWRLQEVVSWILENQAERTQAGHYSAKGDPEKAAEKFRDVLGVSVEEQFGSGDAYSAFELWRARLEAAGFLVLKLGMSRDSIRGFSLYDDFAPLVVVNSSYGAQARIFTLFHEVGHIATKTEAPCLEYFPGGGQRGGGQRGAGQRDGGTKRDIESWCDQFSAALLMPKAEFISLAEDCGIAPGSSDIDIEVVDKLARKFKVSIRAASIRLQTLGLADPGFYYRVEDALRLGDFSGKTGATAGKHTAARRLDEYGQRPIQLLLEAYERSDVSIMDLLDFLNTKIETLDEIRNKIAVQK